MEKSLLETYREKFFRSPLMKMKPTCVQTSPKATTATIEMAISAHHAIINLSPMKKPKPGRARTVCIIHPSKRYIQIVWAIWTDSMTNHQPGQPWLTMKCACTKAVRGETGITGLTLRKDAISPKTWPLTISVSDVQ